MNNLDELYIKTLCDKFHKYNSIDSTLNDKFLVKRGLRNIDGTGVLAGLTKVCNVHGYLISDGERVPDDGALFYRGYNIKDIIESTNSNGRFGFEEVMHLLILGELPTANELELFKKNMALMMELPNNFFEDMILKAPSSNIMNKLSRSVLALYSYDDDADNTCLESEVNKAISLSAKMSSIMIKAYQVRQRFYEKDSMYLHPMKENVGVAEQILSLLRIDREYTKEEALLLDLCLILHAEHGGGNNSTFACRVLSSSGTDAYSAYAGAISSLKGPKHGGANAKVSEMVDDIKANVKDITNRQEVSDYLSKIINKQAGDRTGLVYGMGHAVYTKSDPRAIILKESALKLVTGSEVEDEFTLLRIIEEETPRIFEREKGSDKAIGANVDLYSGLVYKMLKIPEELFTPLFATARMPGWSAHRLEELFTCNRIIRPAYKPVIKPRCYVEIENRE